ncbi:uncharacterized protein DSM5745_01555 [Aspergillus mulundensis]|uniref:non-specific serine/threonine protein kinase n=1 Tax=Aspergillus mulundensis TaxID=1810919 RepID=A0A3D8T6Q5_9EURO|nr:hypothetical protein DSM5745_01555 [Aspergillus mulundensis]RDW94233.1 hypothetical protein DSM5745_01555 [Aspergillus mulundensis]
MRRFETIHDVVEPVEEYRPGGYHPVHLDDVICYRYKIIAKLGFGRFSTVWLAQDLVYLYDGVNVQRYVALKILKPGGPAGNTELATHQFLPSVYEQSRENVVELLNFFFEKGPNGMHLCLVFPVMLGDCQDLAVTGKPRCAADVRLISKQILLGLDVIHREGFIHCGALPSNQALCPTNTRGPADLQPANILITKIGAAEGEDQSLLDPPEFSPVKWLDGVEADNSAPRYLVPSQKRRGALDGVDFSTLLFTIGDLGSVVNNELTPIPYIAMPNLPRGYDCLKTRPATPTALRAPELIHQDKWGVGIDIWALGCLIFQLATNEPLFPIGTFGLSREDIDAEHLRQIEQVLGGGPERFVEHLAARLPADFGEQNTRSLASFLLLMLQLDPARRMGTGELLDQRYLHDAVEE